MHDKKALIYRRFLLFIFVFNTLYPSIRNGCHGGTISYQWYKNSKNATTGGTPISGETASSYTPSTATIGTLYYYVVVTNTVEIDGVPVSASNTCGMREEIVIPKAPEVYDIIAETGSVLEDVTLDIIKAKQYEDYKGTITPATGYLLPSTIVVTVGGKTLVAGTDYIYDKETGSLVIYHVTAQPTVKAKGILIPQTIYTISFNTNGGTPIVPPISGKSGTVVTMPSPPTKAGYSFTGWYKDPGFTTSYTETKIGNENITLYAKWVQGTFEITGDVVDEDNLPVGTATVKLMAGSRKVAQVTTDSDGKFTITGVPAGTYNIVITKDGQTVTQVITISNKNVTIGTITLPKGNTNSIVNVKPNTPDIVVDKLDQFFQTDSQFTQDDQNVVDSGGTVEIKLDVEKKDETGDNQADNVEDIKTAAANKKEIGIFLDLTVNKIVTPEVNGNSEKPLKLSELANVLILNIPLPTELQGKNNYVIYRYHGLGVQEITQTSIILHTKKFSTYAIAYDPVTPDNGGGSGTKSPTITTEINGGGKITISKDKKEATITPGEIVEFRDNPKDFIDNTIAWAKGSIDFVTEREIFVGTKPQIFAPNEGMTRGMFVTVIGRLYERSYAKITGENTFLDVNPEDYYVRYVGWAHENGIITGRDGGNFTPKANATRAEVAAVIERFIKIIVK